MKSQATIVFELTPDGNELHQREGAMPKRDTHSQEANTSSCQKSGFA